MPVVKVIDTATIAVASAALGFGLSGASQAIAAGPLGSKFTFYIGVSGTTMVAQTTKFEVSHNGTTWFTYVSATALTASQLINTGTAIQAAFLRANATVLTVGADPADALNVWVGY